MVNVTLKMRILEKFDTQGDFAVKAGIPEHKISRFIRNRDIPTVKEAEIIAHTLEIKISDIFKRILREKEIQDVV